jgi:hypothetical protein
MSTMVVHSLHRDGHSNDWRAFGALIETSRRAPRMQRYDAIVLIVSSCESGAATNVTLRRGAPHCCDRPLPPRPLRLSLSGLKPIPTEGIQALIHARIATSRENPLRP